MVRTGDDTGDNIVAFANILKAAQTRTAAVDLMRHGPEAPPNTMEFPFTALMLRLKDEGVAASSRGMVPFAGLETGRDDTRHGDLWSRSGARVHRRGERFCTFEGLRRVKAKFDSEWCPRHLCCRTVLPPVAPRADAARLTAGSARGLIGK